jgi:hypothetical protein
MRKDKGALTGLGAHALLAHSLEYHLVPGNLGIADPSNADLYNRAFAFWKGFWSEVFRTNGTSDQPNPDDFLRQHYLGIFEHRGQPVAMHAHSIFDLRQLAAREHSYLSGYFTEGFFEALVSRGASRVLSTESYSVAPEWRAPKLGVSLAAVMVGLGLKLAQSEGVDASIAVARSDNGGAQMGRSQGWITLDSGLRAHNTPVELMACFPDLMHPHSDDRVAKLVEYFWKKREQNHHLKKGARYGAHG